MSILVAIMGCELHARDGHHQAIRETWGSNLTGWADLKFFVGCGGQELDADEVRINCSDVKEQLIYKVEGLLRWAVDAGYSSILKVNTNTYVNVDAIRRTGHSECDYAGMSVGQLGQIYSNVPGIHGFIQGSASWLSNRAARIVLDSEVAAYAERVGPPLLGYTEWISPYPHSEDLWIGQVLTQHLRGLNVCVDRGYSEGPLTYWSQSNHIKLYCLGEWMHRLHEARGDDSRMQQINNEYPKGWQS